MATKKPQPAYLRDPGPQFNWDAGDEFIRGLQAEVPEQVQPSGFMRRAADYGISALKGAIGVPEALVGMADLATGGRAGKAAEAIGFRPAEAKAILDEMYSPEQKAAFKEVQQAGEGEDMLPRIGAKAAAALRNPSVVGQAITESLPVMGMGGVIGRGAMAAIPRIGGVGAAALGEGAVTAGSQAEQVRQQTEDGLLTGKQALLAAGSGAVTGALSMGGGALAKRLGIGDIDTLIATGGIAAPDVRKGIVRKAVEGAVSEGVLEEMPQSVQEQVAVNAALGKPLDEGVADSAVIGTLSGGAMGAGAANMGRPGDALREQKLGTGGVLARAVDQGIEAQASAADLLALPAPTISVRPDGTALTTDQRQGMREDTGGIVESGAMGLGRNSEPALVEPEKNQATAEQNIARFAGSRPGMELGRALAIQQSGQQQGIDLTVIQHPDGQGFMLIPPQFLTPELRAAADQDVQARRARIEGILDAPAGLTRQKAGDGVLIDPVEAYIRARASEGTPQARAFMQEVAAGRITADDIKALMQFRAETAEDRLAAAAAQAQPQDELTNRLVRAAQEAPKPMQGDILAPSGQPFKNITAAKRAAKQQGGQVVEIAPTQFVVRPEATDVSVQSRPGGLVAGSTDGRGDQPAGGVVDTGSVPDVADAPTIRPDAAAPVAGDGSDSPVRDAQPVPGAVDAATAEQEAAAQAPAAPEQPAPAAAVVPAAGPADLQAAGVAGDKINRAWTAFSPESGTKGVPRAEMPQVKAGDRSALVQYLRARGVDYQADEEIPAADLKPTQAEFSPAKVKKAKQHEGGDRSILVSADGYVVDGHHQWLAALEDGKPVKAIRLDAPIDQLLPMVHEFPSAKQAGGATPASQPASAAPESAAATPEGAQDGIQEVGQGQGRREALLTPPAAAGEAVPPAAAPAPSPSVPQSEPRAPKVTEPAPKKRQTVTQRAAAARAAKLADYFAPGNIVKSYGGFDRVISHTPAANADGTWTVEVQAVQKKGGQWVPTDEKPRRHSTEPSERDLKVGPITDVIQSDVTAITKNWKNAPPVVIAFDMQDEAIPEVVRQADQQQRSQGAAGDPEGFYYKGTVYLLASQIKSMDDTARVLFHEALGHYGLRGTFGPQLGAILDELAQRRRGDVARKAAEYGMDMSDPRQARVAAEELLAEMAQTTPDVGWVQRALAAIRGFLRKLGLNVKISDAEIVANFIVPARRWVQRESQASPLAQDTAFSRDASFAESVAAVLDGKRPESQSLKVSEALPVLTALGLKPLPVSTTGDRIAKLHFDHGLTRKEILQLPALLANPVMVFDSDTQKGSLVAVLDLWKSGRPVVAAIRPDYKMDRLDVHLLASAYPKDNPGTMGKWYRDGLLRYADKKKTRAWATSGGVQFPWLVQLLRGSSKDSVLGPSDVGNTPDDAAFSRTMEFDSEKIRAVLSDLSTSKAGARVSWWDKTIGTQYAKAEKYAKDAATAGFKRTFDLLQRYNEDTSALANEAADKAIDVLPRLETVRDLANTGLSKADAQALAGPVFEGTLEWTRDKDGRPVRTDDVGTAGIVWTPAELKSRFGLTEKQIDHYRQFRAAVDTSLEQAVAADVLRLAGEEYADLRGLVSSDRAGLRSKLLQRLEKAAQEATGKEKAGQAQLLEDVREKFARVDELKGRGYAPLMRFGRYKVHATRGSDTVFFGLYETAREANQAARALQADPTLKGASIERGMLSEEAYRLMAQVPVESLEMFADALGAEQSAVFKEYIRLAKNNRSALKRMLQRKGTEGYSEDARRVLASFVVSNARLASQIMNMGDARRAAESIQAGDVKDEAVRLIESVQNPVDTMPAARGLLFAHFLGGSIASALVNATQPVTMTLPYLSQWGGATKAGARLVAAAKLAAQHIGGAKIADPALAAALKQAEDEGIVRPQEIHHLMAEASGSLGRNDVLRKLAFVWGMPFSLAEQFNRQVSFIAAWNTAKAEGMADPMAFAEKAVIETQGLYNSGNRSNWARNPFGAVALTFKQFSVHYLEWLGRMWKSGPEGKKAAGLAIAILLLAAGADGVPFAGDLDDAVDTLGQAMGYDFSLKRVRHDFAKSVLGDTLGDIATRGLSTTPGIPFDISARMGMADLIPATGLFMKSTTDRTKEVSQVAGAAGSVLNQYADAGKEVLSGNLLGGVKGVLPLAVQNAIKGASMAINGEARDIKGRRVMDVDGVDALMKAIGLQPQKLAAESQRIGMVKRGEDLAKVVEAEIAAQWAAGIRDQDTGAVKEARAALAKWNEQNPNSPIDISVAQVRRRVRDMKATRGDRFLKTIAPERRKAVAAALADGEEE